MANTTLGFRVILVYRSITNRDRLPFHFFALAFTDDCPYWLG